MKQQNPHPGARIDAIPVTGIVGLIFSVGVFAMLSFALPHIGQFLWRALAAGILFGAYRI